MTLFNQVITKICLFEGYHSRVYLDPVGLPTIGYGHRTYKSDRRRLSIEESRKLLIEDYNKVLDDFEYFPFVLMEHETFALADLCFNVGLETFKKSNTFKYVQKYSTCLDNGYFVEAEQCRQTIAKALLTWNHGTVNGKKVVLNGLTTRCEFRRKLWLYGRVY